MIGAGTMERATGAEPRLQLGKGADEASQGNPRMKSLSYKDFLIFDFPPLTPILLLPRQLCQKIARN